eukprot:TRINITY_DN3749_c0_g1_i3.p2 TRINITY_DN3749_c0_g1~~TRINITY_DN3749_c0_g1_i3.p2  ORF type:complete len:283 (-),score=48.34 TRINITY_DN3749_c0_g1_i3:1612-2460(-)
MSENSGNVGQPVVTQYASRSISDSSEILEEQKWHKTGENLAMSNYNEKIIEQKEKELQDAILRNYSKIKDAESELTNLQLQLKLTAGPKKSALELLRKKIESQNDKVVAAREKVAAAKKIYDAAEAELKAEEGAKDALCQELNLLVHQSTKLQLDKLEQLTQRIESLSTQIVKNPSTSSTDLPISSPHGVVDQTSEQKAIVVEAQKQIVAQKTPAQQALASRKATMVQSKGGQGQLAKGVQGKPGNLQRQRSVRTMNQSGLLKPQAVRQQPKQPEGEFQGFD